MASGQGLNATFTAYKIPLYVIAKWPTGNFTHPQRRKWAVPYSIALQVLVTLVVTLRIWTRIRKQAGGLGLDDGLIIVAWALAGGFTGMAVYGVHGAGLDRHVWDITPATAEKSGLVAWVTELLFLSSLCLTKVSVLLFFQRLVDHTHSTWISKAIWAAVIFTSIYFLGFFLFLIFGCWPIHAAWRSLNITWSQPYKCVDRSQVDPWNGILSVFSDVYSIAIPCLIVSRLKMPWDRKALLYVVFGCGLAVIGAGIARTIYLSRLYTDPLRDLTWVGYDLLVWANLEMQLAIISASAPAMKGFLSAVRDKVSTRYGYDSRSSTRKGGVIGSSGNVTGSRDNFAKLSDEQWADKSGPWNDRTSHELLETPGKRVRVQDGSILVTETFSVNREDPYAKERRVLGI